jgi:hypothetical protein
MKIQSAVIAAAIASTLATTGSLSAQTTEGQAAPEPKSRWEVAVPSGSLIPTGAQRDAIKRGNLTAIQLTYVARPALAITSTFGWARSRDIQLAGSPKLDVFTYDVGAEARAPQWVGGKAITFRPFVGAGAGARSYNHRKLDIDATHNVAAYASAGGDLGVRRIRIRLEARDYVAGFRPLAGEGTSRTGNDVVVMVGVRYVSR